MQSVSYWLAYGYTSVWDLQHCTGIRCDVESRRLPYQYESVNEFVMLIPTPQHSAYNNKKNTLIIFIFHFFKKSLLILVQLTCTYDIQNLRQKKIYLQDKTPFTYTSTNWRVNENKPKQFNTTQTNDQLVYRITRKLQVNE